MVTWAGRGTKMSGHGVSETLDEVETDLKDEEDVLLKMKELVLKEIMVLKVNWVPS